MSVKVSHTAVVQARRPSIARSQLSARPFWIAGFAIAVVFSFFSHAQADGQSAVSNVGRFAQPGLDTALAPAGTNAFSQSPEQSVAAGQGAVMEPAGAPVTAARPAADATSAHAEMFRRALPLATPVANVPLTDKVTADQERPVARAAGRSDRAPDSPSITPARAPSEPQVQKMPPASSAGLPALKDRASLGLTTGQPMLQRPGQVPVAAPVAAAPARSSVNPETISPPWWSTEAMPDWGRSWLLDGKELDRALLDSELNRR